MEYKSNKEFEAGFFYPMPERIAKSSLTGVEKLFYNACLFRVHTKHFDLTNMEALAADLGISIHCVKRRFGKFKRLGLLRRHGVKLSLVEK